MGWAELNLIEGSGVKAFDFSSALHGPEDEYDDSSDSAGTECGTAADPGDDAGEDDGDDDEPGPVLARSAAGAADAADARHHVDEAEDAEDDEGEDEVTDGGVHFDLSVIGGLKGKGGRVKGEG